MPKSTIVQVWRAHKRWCKEDTVSSSARTRTGIWMEVRVDGWTQIQRTKNHPSNPHFSIGPAH